jgi:hypothetical protein
LAQQAVASCGKLVAAALRNSAAMMRRMRARSSPLAAPGRRPLALWGGGRRACGPGRRAARSRRQQTLHELGRLAVLALPEMPMIAGLGDQAVGVELGHGTPG